MQNAKKRIDLKRYFLSTLGFSLFLFFVGRMTPREGLGLLIFYFFTLLNQAFLLLGLEGLITPPDGQVRPKKTLRVIIFLSTKFLVLAGGLVLCVHFMGSKLFIALINYLAQIFILFWCLRRNS